MSRSAEVVHPWGGAPEVDFRPPRSAPSWFMCSFFFSELARIIITCRPVMEATEIMLDYGDYFTILLTGIPGMFVNNPPLSS